MPLTMPLPRYFSMPSRVVGAEVLSRSALNCSPNSRSRTHLPSAVSHSPGLTVENEPTTVTSSRCPRALILTTPKPFSSLKNVMRSIKPVRLSTGVAAAALVDGCGCCCNRSHDVDLEGGTQMEPYT